MKLMSKHIHSLFKCLQVLIFNKILFIDLIAIPSYFKYLIKESLMEDIWFYMSIDSAIIILIPEGKA